MTLCTDNPRFWTIETKPAPLFCRARSSELGAETERCRKAETRLASVVESASKVEERLKVRNRDKLHC